MKLKNSMELSIKQATVEDAPLLVEYLNLVGGESDNLLFGANECVMEIEDEEEYILNMSKSENSALMVGKIGDEVVCLGAINGLARTRIAHQADIALSVKKKNWGQGIGSCLVGALIDFAKQTEKIEIIHLGVKAENTIAQKIYKKYGFEEVGVHKNFFKINGEYFDEIVMDLHL